MNWTVPFSASNKIGDSWLRRFMATVDRRWIAYSRWRVEQRATAQLNAMSDRELKDIGLIRSEISRAVNIVPFDAAGLGSNHEPHLTKWRGVTCTVR